MCAHPSGTCQNEQSRWDGKEIQFIDCEWLSHSRPHRAPDWNRCGIECHAYCTFGIWVGAETTATRTYPIHQNSSEQEPHFQLMHPGRLLSAHRLVQAMSFHKTQHQWSHCISGGHFEVRTAHCAFSWCWSLHWLHSTFQRPQRLSNCNKFAYRERAPCAHTLHSVNIARSAPIRSRSKRFYRQFEVTGRNQLCWLGAGEMVCASTMNTTIRWYEKLINNWK